MWASFSLPASGYQGHNLTLVLIRSHLDHPDNLTVFIQIGPIMHLGLGNTPASSHSLAAVCTLPLRSLDAPAVHQMTSQLFHVLLWGPQSKLQRPSPSPFLHITSLSPTNKPPPFHPCLYMCRPPPPPIPAQSLCSCVDFSHKKNTPRLRKSLPTVISLIKIFFSSHHPAPSQIS